LAEGDREFGAEEFQAMRDEVTEDWRRLQKNKLHDLFSSSSTYAGDQIKRLKWVGHVARMFYKSGGYRVLVGRPAANRPICKNYR
jgi:hypothetical protein